MLSVFCSPSRYTQGKNATAFLGMEMAGLGLRGPALIVGSRSPIRLLSETWKRTLAEAGIAYVVHEFGGECSLAEIERIKQAAQQNKSQVLIGAGGGKVLDAARAAAADLSLPIVNCPTVASSDSPCSALSVIYSEDGIVQGSRFHRKNADLVLVDTQVIANSPPRLLVAGMGDALATWFEAKTCVDGGVKNLRGGLSTQSALALAKLCYRTLLADGADALRGSSPGGDTGSGTTGGSEHAPIGAWIRVIGPRRGPCGSQRTDHGTGHPRLPARRKSRIRIDDPACARGQASRGRGSSAGFRHRGRAADHAGRNWPERLAEGTTAIDCHSRRRRVIRFITNRLT